MKTQNPHFYNKKMVRLKVTKYQLLVKSFTLSLLVYSPEARACEGHTVIEVCGLTCIATKIGTQLTEHECVNRRGLVAFYSATPWVGADRQNPGKNRRLGEGVGAVKNVRET